MICDTCLKELNSAYWLISRARNAEETCFAKRREELEHKEEAPAAIAVPLSPRVYREPLAEHKITEKAKSTRDVRTHVSMTAIDESKNMNDKLNESLQFVTKTPTPAHESVKIVTTSASQRLINRTDHVSGIIEKAPVIKIMGRRMNLKLENEYLVKWEAKPQTWEPATHLDTCKDLIENFEVLLAKQKEMRAKSLLLDLTAENKSDS
jgi:Chromo (CHRromatin Organisation MOdifier) domain